MRSKITQHPIQQLSSLLLFLLFVMFLLPVLILSAGAYRTSVEAENLNSNLYTASNYITTKFHQFDSLEDGHSRIEITTIGALPALSFTEEIEGTGYRTWLYLLNGELKELFAKDTGEEDVALLPDPDMGMRIASLSVFDIQSEDGTFWFTLEDENHVRSRFCLHAGAPGIR